MKIRERLLECKIKLAIKSDYALADAIGCSTQAISELNKEVRKPDAYFAVKIGEILGVHPLMLLAEFEAEKAKTVERRAFWENFGRRIKTGAVGMLVLIFTSSLLLAPRANARALDTHNVYSGLFLDVRKYAVILQL